MDMCLALEMVLVDGMGKENLNWNIWAPNIYFLPTASGGETSDILLEAPTKVLPRWECKKRLGQDFRIVTYKFIISHHQNLL